MDKRLQRLAEFFDKERRKLIAYVRYRIDDTAAQDGEDIVQEVMLNIFEKADITVPIENLASYVYQSLRNRITDIFRGKQEEAISLSAPLRDGHEETLADVLADTRNDTSHQVEKNDLVRRLHQALDALEDEEKAVIVETEFNDRPFQELSLEWDIPLGTLLARKSRALAKIKKIMNE
jgi:RNA polymerase sigma factor (sigma-70 family)